VATELKDLSPDQQKVVESWGQGLAVMAGAGAGKTTTLVIKCEELIKRKPDARFAAVSFTERSTSDLRAKLSTRLNLHGNGGVLSGHWVMTIHGLCGAIIREFPREAGFDGEESILSEAGSRLLWERALEALWFGDLPLDVEQGIEKLLRRESRESVIALLTRTRDLHSFGAVEAILKSSCEVTRALGLVSRFVLDRYDRLKKRRGAIDFGDLELGADRALNFRAVCEQFHRRFDLVMVDEFQDTNPLQSQIILKFTRPDLSNLCVIGDPKQSIYRFRDADVTVFEEFCSRLPVQQSLSWNFRSRPDIIEYTNHVCQKAFEASEMVYEKLEPKREKQAAGESVLRLDVEDPSRLAEWIRAEVARGIALDEMVLLVRRIRGNEKWFKALSAAGIPLAMGSGGLFWEDPRVRELVAFLKWWDHPVNALSGAIFLRAPWVGVSDEVLDVWVKEDSTWVKPFFESNHSIAKALAPLKGKLIRPGELLMALLINSEIEDEIGSALLGLWHRVEEYSSDRMDFHTVVLELSRALEEGRRERDVPPPKNQGQLPVLTFHAAKGLEFTHVILVDFGKKSRAGASPLLFWDRKEGVYLAPRNADGDRDDDVPAFTAWKALEKERNLAESKRIFYVALTRAKERLIFVCLGLSINQIEKRFDADESYFEDDWRAWIECAGRQLDSAWNIDVDVGLSSAPAEVEDRVPSVIQSNRRNIKLDRDFYLVRPRHSVTEWNVLSRCPRAYEWKWIRPRVVSSRPEGDPRAVQDPKKIDFRELGMRVHAALEKADFDALIEIEARFGEESFKAEPVIQWAQTSILMSIEDQMDAWNELAFEIPIRGEVLVGSIDRLILNRLGEYQLVDFKVSSKQKRAEELLHAYQTQMELYAHAVCQLQSLHASAHDICIRGSLIHISPQAVVEVPVQFDLDKIKQRVEDLATTASKIVSGTEGVPCVGQLCRVCEFRPICDVGGDLR